MNFLLLALPTAVWAFKMVSYLPIFDLDIILMFQESCLPMVWWSPGKMPILAELEASLTGESGDRSPIKLDSNGD